MQACLQEPISKPAARSRTTSRPPLPAHRTIGEKFSLRAYYQMRDDKPHVAYKLTLKGSRSHHDEFATILPSTDGKSFIVSMSYMVADARPSLEDAIALATARYDKMVAARGY